jgi:phosphohistidine phosphatase SixA
MRECKMRIPLLYAATFAAGACLLPALLPAQTNPAVPPPPPGRTSNAAVISNADLLAGLRKGGLVIYFRHTSTDFSRDDANSRSDEDCANQRPLTDRGREEARAIGAAMRKLDIPLGRVLASPRCRTLETAVLAFGDGEKTNAVRGGRLDAQNEVRYAALKKLLVTAPAPGTNLIITSHGNPFYALAGPPYLAEGEAAVLRPTGGDFVVIGRVRHDAWLALAK